MWAGASDLRVYEVCLRRGWPLYVSDDLHAKLYSVDLSSAFVGSANVTRRGLGLAEVRNDEALCFIESMTEGDRLWLLRLIQRARYVTPEFHQGMIEWLDKASSASKAAVPRLKCTVLVRGPLPHQSASGLRFSPSSVGRLLCRLRQ